MSSPIEKLDTRTPPSTRSLLLRVLSSLVLMPIVMFGVYIGGRFFASMVAFVCIVMIFEWIRMVERRDFGGSFYLLAVSAVISFYLAANADYGFAAMISSLGGVAVFFYARKKTGLGFWSAMAPFYILLPSIALIWLRQSADDGRALTFILFITVWAADIGAFIFGKLIGGPKISHALSPSKTWAGIGGGVVGGALIGVSAGVYLLGAGAAIWCFGAGGLLGAASVSGDLAESALKRHFGLKDISGFIPGHGGALDRLDGMIFATAAMTFGYFIYKLLAQA